MIAVETKHPWGWEHTYLRQISIEPFAFNITLADVYYIDLLTPPPESIFGKFLLCCHHIIPKRRKVSLNIEVF